MLKYITSAVLAGSFAFAAPQNASACCGGLFGLCGNKSTCNSAPAASACEAQPGAPSTPAATPDMPDVAPPAPTTAQNSTTRYRTYSYDPTPAYRAPAARSYSNSRSSQQNQFSAGRKMFGLQ